jgi:hypothetical protein
MIRIRDVTDPSRHTLRHEESCHTQAPWQSRSGVQNPLGGLAIG